MWKTIKTKTKAGYNWIKTNLKKTGAIIAGLFIATAFGASMLPADQATFNVHRNQIATAMTEQVLNASSTLPFSRENATFRKYNKETSAFLTIGKKGSDIFVPEFTITNWKETMFKLTIPTSVAPKDHTISFPTQAKTVKGKTATTSRLKWSDGVNDAVFYELDNGDFEFEYILNSIPASNVIEFDIETEGLDFWYQPALTQQEIDEGAFRPIEVIGSYAVYYKDGVSGDYSKVGGQNYKVGKAFHMYRVRATDNTGDWTWTDQNIDTVTGKWTITIPQLWLNNATYPVTI